MWIENYRRRFENVELNFHPGFKFTLEKKPEPYNNYLERVSLRVEYNKKLSSFIKDYFPENQLISLIVGKNGTGKSSILDLLVQVKEIEYKNNKFFCIFFDDEEKDFISYRAIFNDNWKNAECIRSIKNIIDKAEQHEEKITFPLTLYIPETEITDEINKELSIFYISSEYDKYDKSLSLYRANAKYLSYYGKIQYELENLKELENHVSCKGLLGIVRNRIETSFWINLFANFDLLNDIFKVDKDIKFPQRLYITIREFDFLEGRRLNEFLVEEENKENPKYRLAETLNNLITTYRHLRTNMDFFSLLRLGFIIYFLFDEFKSDFNEIKIYEEILNRIGNINEIKSSKNIREDIKKLYEKLKKDIIYENDTGGRKTIYPVLSNSLERADSFVSILEELRKYHIIKIIQGNAGIVIRSLHSVSEKLEKVLRELREIPFTRLPLIEIEAYPYLSSGHKALFSIFSDIDNLMTLKYDNEKPRKNILLLLDEPETYFHPEWQRLFIYLLTEFLRRKYGDSHNFHIIITTHSPFLLSDIPEESCVFLELNEDGKTKVKSKDEISNTLAQNIYHLLADGFFMKKGIGEYIHQKLKEYLKKINDGELQEREEKEFKNLLNHVGDTVLRNKLLHIMERKDFYKGKLIRGE